MQIIKDISSYYCNTRDDVWANRCYQAYLENLFTQNKQPIYMKILQRCLTGREDLVCKILKYLYSLK